MDILFRSSNDRTKIVKERLTILARKKNFSNDTIHPPGEESELHTEYEVIFDGFAYEIGLAVYANGSDDKNAGFVSLSLHYEVEKKSHFDVVVFVSVVDSCGNQRFPMNFTFSSEFEYPTSSHINAPCLLFDVGKYIQRKTVLDEDSDLISEDVLTLHIDIQSRRAQPVIKAFVDIRETISGALMKKKKGDKPMCYLRLKSDLAQLLCEESNYFRRVSVTDMMEKKDGLVNIPMEELRCFYEVASVIMGQESICLDSVYQIFDMYVIADKYDIPSVTETCLCFLKLCLSDHDASEVLRASEEYDLWNLKEIVQNILKNKTSDQLGQNLLNSTYEWTYNQINVRNGTLVFNRRRKTVNTLEKTDFDFYC